MLNGEGDMVNDYDKYIHSFLHYFLQRWQNQTKLNWVSLTSFAAIHIDLKSSCLSDTQQNICQKLYKTKERCQKCIQTAACSCVLTSSNFH